MEMGMRGRQANRISAIFKLKKAIVPNVKREAIIA